MNIKCFWVEPTDRVRLKLRRYVSGPKCPTNPHGYHNAEFPLGERPARFSESREDGGRSLDYWDWLEPEFVNHPNWPVCCACGYQFTDADERQIFQELIYRRADTGEETTLRDAPHGAMWDSWWFGDHYKGPDGIRLTVKLPPDGYDWLVDSRASNCTMPNDNTHKCWVRHGDPRTGNVHVDKNGHTCAAGAGSIATPRWHGFLHNGELVSC